MKSIAVCVINFNARDLLRDCLHSVLKEAPGEIIVVDNSSADGSADMVRAEFPSARLICLSKNLGYGAAANRAVGNCRTEFILLLNSDTRLTPGSLQALCDYLDKIQTASVIGPRILNTDGTFQTSSFYFPTPVHIFLYLSGLYKIIHYVPILRGRSLQTPSSGSAAVVPWVLGAAFAFRREAFESVGGFDESFFMYFEEVDLCFRLAKNGRQTHFAPVTEIMHVGGASTEQQRVEMNVQFFESLARFYRKHYPRIRLAELVLIVRFFALFRLARDTIRLQVTREKAKRATLIINVEVCRRLLLGHWIGQPDPGGVLTV